jgi:hypothetical protein
MNDAAEKPEVNFDADPKPVKKAKTRTKKKAKAAVTSAPKSTAPFPGLTRTLCATACSAIACAISCKPYCAHPTKGALQAVDMNDPAALRRLQEARDQINVRIDPDRFK